MKLDGKFVSGIVKDELKKRIVNLKKHNIIPGLAVVLVGDRTDSATYVRMKQKTCEKLGILSILRKLPEYVSQKTLVHVIEELNNDPSIHGILVQLPLPKHIDSNYVLEKVDINKDVDGFHITNMGNLLLKRKPRFSPCTPLGCMKLLDYYNITVSGKKAVILGRSNIVGLPISLMLLHRGATITICHSKTENTKEIVKTADIIIACCGQTQMVKKDWVKPGAFIIDVGINSIEDKTRKRGYRLVGDVDYENIKDIAGGITPVPGGVGPMTIAMLMEQTVKSAEYSSNIIDNELISDKNIII